MPSPFPFFRLPILIQLLVLEHLGLLELFYLSLISERSKQIVKSLNVTLSKLCWDLFSRRKCTVKLTAPNRTGLYSRFHTAHIIWTLSEKINVNGVVVPVAVTRERNGPRACLDIQTISVEESWELMDKFTEHFLELFKVSKCEVRLPVVPNLRSWFIWKYTKHFGTVIVTDWQDNGTRLSGQLTSDDLKFVLEELTIDDSLDIQALVEEGVRYSGALKMKELCVRCGCWLTLEAILNMDCEMLYFHSTTNTYQDLNTIIKKSLTGGLKNLKYLRLYYTHQLEQDSINTKLDQVLEGIEYVPYVASNRPENVIVSFEALRYIPTFPKGRDIRRSDGTIATVNFANNYFVFYIWNHLSVNQLNLSSQ